MFKTEKIVKLLLVLASLIFGFLSEREHHAHPLDGGIMILFGVLSLICLLIAVIMERSDTQISRGLTGI